MPHQIGYVDNSSGLAHYAMLAAIKTFAESNGWTVLRYDIASANQELILLAPGLSGTEEIYCGIRTYQDAGADYYNLCAMAATGYVPGNSFDTQPSCILSGVPAHNQRIDYWMSINGQRLICVMKVGTPVYESLYIGKILPYGRPSQYPYPLLCGGMLSGAALTRFSDTAHGVWAKGNRANLKLMTNAGWVQPFAFPWQNTILAGSTQLRDTGGVYPLVPVELNDASENIWGALDGVYYVSGFDNAVENTITLAGVTYLIVQDVWRTGFTDYYAIRLDV